MCILRRYGLPLMVLLLGAWLWHAGTGSGAVSDDGDRAPLPGSVVCSAAVPGHGVVEFRESAYRRRPLWLYYCRWVTPDGRARDYYVFTSSEHWRRAAFRWDKRRRGVWLTIDGSHVGASLAVDSGRFVGENGVVMDPRLPLGRQERAGLSRGQPGHPDWARPNRGVLLVECAP